MKKYKYVILGAGATGLSLAVTLLKGGENNFIVLEREKTAGGLGRSVYKDGAPVDIGGVHVLSPFNKKITDFIFSYLPEKEWVFIQRHNKVVFDGYEIDYPLEANIWQLPKDAQKKYLDSIKNADSQKGVKMPDNFVDWAYWKFGDKIAENYIIPYNKKIWNCDLRQLSTKWLYKLPKVSYEDILQSCIDNKPHGSMPAHSQYYFPKKYGFGEVFLRMEKELGENIITDYTVNKLDWKNRIINGEIQGDYIINTIPWCEFSSEFPEEIKEKISKLKNTSININYYKNDCTHKAQITYFSDPALPYHRTVYRKEMMARDDAVGYWTEANSELGVEDGDYFYKNQYAYPISTKDKEENISAIKKWAEENNILSLGRWGDWEHMNSDVAMDHAIQLAENLLKNT